MATPTVSEAQRATRRRALGRLLIRTAGNLDEPITALKGSPDVQYLTAKEASLVEKQVAALETVRANFSKLGQHLEKSE